MGVWIGFWLDPFTGVGFFADRCGRRVLRFFMNVKNYLVEVIGFAVLFARGHRQGP
jgi:hypothetical protein